MDPELLKNLKPDQLIALLNAIDPAQISKALDTVKKSSEAAFSGVLSERERQISELTNKIQELSNENKSFKTKAQANDFESKISALQNELLNQVKSVQLDVARERAIRAHNLNEREAMLLVGGSAEEISKSAQAIADLRQEYKGTSQQAQQQQQQAQQNTTVENAGTQNTQTSQGSSIDLSSLAPDARTIVEQALAIASKAQSVEPPPAQIEAGQRVQTEGVGHQFLNLKTQPQGQAAVTNQVFNNSGAGAGTMSEAAIKNMSMAEYSSKGRNASLQAAQEMLKDFAL